MAIPTVRHLNDLMRWLLEMLQKLGGNVLLIRHLVPNRRRGNAAPLALEPLGGPQPDPLMHIFQPAAQQAPRGARVVQQPAQGAPAMGAPLGVPLPVQMPFLRLTSSPIVPSTCSMELSPFSQTVRIDHFSHLMMANEPGIPVIRSTPFPAGQPFSFYLKILPNGFEEARFLGIVVGRMENQERQESDLLYFRLSLVDVHGLKRLPTVTLRTFLPTGTDWGWHRFISHEELLNPLNGLLPNDTLTILCEATHIKINDSNMEEPVSSQSTTQPSPAWLAGLLENSFLSDVKIEVESTIIPAHKFALSIASPVFKTMFEFKDVAENVDSLITLPDMELVVFRLLLKFVYTGTVENMNKHDFNLLIAADKYQMDALLELCEEAIIKNRLNLATASELLSFSIRYHAKKLHKAVTELIETSIRRNLTHILDQPTVAIEVAQLLHNSLDNVSP